jgi:hypothetical protein
MTAKKFKNIEWYTWVGWKVGTKNPDKKYLREQNLLKFFIGTKIKIWDVYRDQKYI